MNVTIQVPAKYKCGWDLGDKNFRKNIDEIFGSHRSAMYWYEFSYISDECTSIFVLEKKSLSRILETQVLEPDPDADYLAIFEIDGIKFLLRQDNV